MKTLARFAVLGLLALSSALTVDQSFAGGRPSNPGNSGSASANSAASEHANVASLAGPANAAHASEQGLAHAADPSIVSRVNEYATLERALASGQLQQAVSDAQEAFDLAYPDFANMSPADQAIALASPEGQLLLQAQLNLQGVIDDRDAVLASLTDNWADPEVKAYIDALIGN